MGEWVWRTQLFVVALFALFAFGYILFKRKRGAGAAVYSISNEEIGATILFSLTRPISITIIGCNFLLIAFFFFLLLLFLSWFAKCHPCALFVW